MVSPKKLLRAITILYRNTNVKVRSPGGVSDFFDIVARVLPGDTLAPYLSIICPDYVLITPIDLKKENDFTLTKAMKRRYTAETITDPDDADDIALLADSPTQAESLLHSLDQIAGGISLCMHTDKMEYMCFNKEGAISTVNGGSLKLVEKFTYLVSSISSTKSRVYTRLAKSWTVIDHMEI